MTEFTQEEQATLQFFFRGRQQALAKAAQHVGVQDPVGVANTLLEKFQVPSMVPDDPRTGQHQDQSNKAYQGPIVLRSDGGREPAKEEKQEPPAKEEGIKLPPQEISITIEDKQYNVQVPVDKPLSGMNKAELLATAQHEEVDPPVRHDATNKVIAERIQEARDARDKEQVPSL